MVSTNLKEVAQNLTNVVPLKPFEGKKSKNATLINLVNYLHNKLLGTEDVRDVIEQDFLSLVPEYPEYQ